MLTFLAPVFVAAAAPLVLGERAGRGVALAMPLCVAGKAGSGGKRAARLVMRLRKWTRSRAPPPCCRPLCMRAGVVLVAQPEFLFGAGAQALSAVGVAIGVGQARGAQLAPGVGIRRPGLGAAPIGSAPACTQH